MTMIAELPRAVEQHEAKNSHDYDRLFNAAVENIGELQTPVDDVLAILRRAGVSADEFQSRVEIEIQRRAELPKLEALAREYSSRHAAWREAKSALTEFEHTHNVVFFDQQRFNPRWTELSRNVSRTQGAWTESVRARETLEHDYPESAFAAARNVQKRLKGARGAMVAIQGQLTKLEWNYKSAQDHIAAMQNNLRESGYSLAPDVKASAQLERDIATVRGELAVVEADTASSTQELKGLIQKHQLQGFYSAD